MTEHTDPNVLITVDFDVSDDDGATWRGGGGFTRRGGNPRLVPQLSATREPVTDEQGAPVFAHALDAEGKPVYEPGIPRDKYGDPLRYVTCHFGFKEPSAKRLVRAHVTVSGGAVMTRLHVVGTPGDAHDKALVPVD